MKKKVPLKNMVWRGGVTRRVLLEGRIDFNREFGKVSKKRGLGKKGVGKTQMECDTQKNTQNVWFLKKFTV